MSDDRTTMVEIDTELLEALRELYPGRTDCEILEGIVREYLLGRSLRREDAMLQALAAAPVDDEESTEEEDHSTCEALAAYHRGEVIRAEEFKREFGID